MNLTEALAARRSIRNFRPDPVPQEKLRAVLAAATSAPSAKNGQQWRFVVAQGAAKEKALAAMEAGLQKEQAGEGLLPGAVGALPWVRHSLATAQQAPAIIFVLNDAVPAMAVPGDMQEVFQLLSSVESVSAAIENLLLAAVGEGLGALWICDIFFAYRELTAWLGTDRQLMAAIALGLPGEAPPPRPRKPLDAVVEWRTE